MTGASANRFPLRFKCFRLENFKNDNGRDERWLWAKFSVRRRGKKGVEERRVGSPSMLKDSDKGSYSRGMWDMPHELRSREMRGEEEREERRREKRGEERGYLEREREVTEEEGGEGEGGMDSHCAVLSCGGGQKREREREVTV